MNRHWGVELLLLVLVVVGVASVVGWYLKPSPKTIEPPTIDLTGADPEVAKAIEEARHEVSRAPRSDLAWGKYGEVLAAHSYDDQAAMCFAEAARLGPKEARWPYFRGLTLLFSDSNQALAQFQHAVLLQSDAPAMRLRLAEELVAQGRLDEAEEHLRQLLGNVTLGPRAQLGLARVVYQRGALDQARQNLAQCEAHPLTRKAAANLLAEIDQHANNPVAAVQDRARAAQLPEDQDWRDPFLEEINRLKVGKNARLDQVLQLVRLHQLKEAEALCRGLVNQYPDWEQAWLTSGRFYLEKRDYPAAENAFQKAIKLAPDSVAGHFYLGVVLFERKAYAEATTQFREVLRVKPDHALAHYNLGHCLKLQNDLAGALEAFRATVRNNPGLAGGHVNLGKLLADKGEKAAAIDELRIGVELRGCDSIPCRRHKSLFGSRWRGQFGIESQPLSPKDESARKLLEQLKQEK